jgi:hypothetical protein
MFVTPTQWIPEQVRDDDYELEAAHHMNRSASAVFVVIMISATGSLTACSRQADAGDVTGAEPIPCRAFAAAAPSADCTVERMATPEGTALTVRNPDGSFRRLLMVGDGRGVIAADGAEPAVVRPGDAKSIDVAIGGMVYRLPARVTR